MGLQTGKHQLPIDCRRLHAGKKLRFAARVRAGFTAAQRAALFELLYPLKAEKCPFADLPATKRVIGAKE